MKDLKITNSGDLIISSSGDLEVVSGDEQLAQAIIFRLKTMRGDYTLSPEIGTSLERFIGNPNSPATWLLIEQEITDTLTKDFSLLAIEVSCVPLGEHEVFVLIETPSRENTDKVIQVQSQLDLKRGLVFPRIDYTIE